MRYWRATHLKRKVALFGSGDGASTIVDGPQIFIKHGKANLVLNCRGRATNATNSRSTEN